MSPKDTRSTRPAMPGSLRVPRGGIAGWPETERPRERLFNRGAHALTDAELIALLVRTGARGQDAVALARGILTAYGSLRNLAQRLPRELAKRTGIGPAKAASILAALELGRRSAAEREAPKAAFRSSADVAAHFLPKCRGLKREVFRIAILDTAHHLMKEQTVTVGTLNLALVHPRDVFKVAIVEDAAGIVLLHNHPSGDPAPSEEDVKLTRQMVRAGEAVGIPVLDHLVLGADRYFSFADSRKLDASDVPPRAGMQA